MNPLKKSLTAIILIAVIIAAMLPAAYADACCVAHLKNIYFTDGHLAVLHNCEFSESGLSQREIRISVSYSTSTGHSRRLEDVRQTVKDNSDHTYIFDNLPALKNVSYYVEIEFTDINKCKRHACKTDMSKSISSGSDELIALVKYDNSFNGKLTPAGSTAAIICTAEENGFYAVGATSNNNSNRALLRNYTNSSRNAVDKYTYLQKGESRIYVVKSSVESTALDAAFSFEKVNPNIQTLKTPNPTQNGALCYTLTAAGLMSFNIPKDGVYHFSAKKASEGQTAHYSLVGINGENIDTFFTASDEAEIYLPAGDYCIYPKQRAAEVDVKYTIPETLQFNKEFTVPKSEGKFGSKIFTLELTRPTVITLTDNSGASLNSPSLIKENYFELNEYSRSAALPAGKYYINAYVSNGSNGNFTLSPSEVPSLVLGKSAEPSAKVNKYGTDYYYVAFSAPKAGKYVFDLTKGSVPKYITKDLAANEWCMLELDSKFDVTVNTFTLPTAVEVQLSTPTKFRYTLGKTYLYSFTPTESGKYKFKSSSFPCDNVEIYTDNKVLCSKTNLSLNASLKFDAVKDEKVYIKFSGNSQTSGSDEYSFEITSAVTKLELSYDNNLAINGEDFAEYTADKDGFYGFFMLKAENSTEMWTPVEAEVNGNPYSFSAYSSPTLLFDLKKGDKISIKILQNNKPCTAKVSIFEVTAKVITPNTETDIAAGECCAFKAEKDGLVQISHKFEVSVKPSGSAFWTNVGNSEYSYFIATAGKTYFIESYEDTTATLSYVDSETLSIDTETKFSGLTAKAAKIEIKETGRYRIKNSLSNANLFITADEVGTYSSFANIIGTDYELFELEAGTHYVLYVPNLMEKITTASAKLTIAKENNPDRALGISLDDTSYSPTEESVTLNLTITAPRHSKMYVGLEIFDENGNTEKTDISDVYTDYGDLAYRTVYWTDGEIGKTYTVRPYVYFMNSPKNIVYGEKKEITPKIDFVVNPIKYNKKVFQARTYTDKYGNQEYFFEFTQPDDAGDKVFVKTDIGSADIYDESFDYVDVDYDSEAQSYFCKVSPGKKYYVAYYSYADAVDTIYISSLPDAPEPVPYAITDAKLTANGVSCNISGITDTYVTLVCALYDDNGKLIELATVKEPSGTESIELKKLDDGTKCKLIVWEPNSIAPLCKATEISTK